MFNSKSSISSWPFSISSMVAVLTKFSLGETSPNSRSISFKLVGAGTRS